MQVPLQEELILKNQGLIHYIARKLGKTPNDIDYEDIISIGQIGLCKAASTFDPSKKTKFFTYAYRCVENEILCNYFRKRRNLTLSLDCVIKKESDGKDILLRDTIIDEKSIDFVKQVEDKDTISKIVSVIINKLSLRDASILLYFLAGTSQRKIAQKNNLTQGLISKRISQSIPKIKKYFNTCRNYEKNFSVMVQNRNFKICIFLEEIEKNKINFTQTLLKINNVARDLNLNITSKDNMIAIYLPAEIDSLLLLARVLNEMR